MISMTQMIQMTQIAGKITQNSIRLPNRFDRVLNNLTLEAL